MRRNLARLAGLVAPPTCCACGSAAISSLCRTCQTDVESGDGQWLRIRSLDAVWAARPYEGAARELVAAIKFKRLLPATGLVADVIASGAPPGLLAGTLVPVPADPLRRAWRGFDPADLLTSELHRRTGMPVSHCLRRRHGARQVGRSRGERIAAPPRVRVAAPPPEHLTLVDDVVTTGATLSACARALRVAGARRVDAIAFAASGHPLGAPRKQA